jgi:hypothetical protein
MQEADLPLIKNKHAIPMGRRLSRVRTFKRGHTFLSDTGHARLFWLLDYLKGESPVIRRVREGDTCFRICFRGCFFRLQHTLFGMSAWLYGDPCLIGMYWTLRQRNQ